MSRMSSTHVLDNTIIHEIGMETKIYVKRGTDVKEDDLFLTQYRRSLRITDRIIEKQNEELKESMQSGQVENVNNIISFIGDRGSGKTSCMLTFANILREHRNIDIETVFKDKDGEEGNKNPYRNLRENDFYLLPTIDPSFFVKNFNIIGSFIAYIFNQFKDETMKTSNNLDDGMIQDFYKALASAQKSFGRLYSESRADMDDMERLEQLSSSIRLKAQIRRLVDVFLCVMGRMRNDGCRQSCSKLVLCIDDIDLNTETAVDMLEWIRKYLIQPNVIILFSLKFDQMVDLKRLKIHTDYRVLLSGGATNSTESIEQKGKIDDMVEKYISKLLPLGYRVYMPDEATLLHVNYITKERYDLSPKQPKTKVLRQAVVEKIFEKTRFLFYNSLIETNMIVPYNLRGALHLMSMLENMYVLPAKPESVNDKGYAEWKSKLKSNQSAFKEYLFEDCLLNNLKSDSRNLIQELLFVSDSARFNSAVLRVLKKKFPQSIEALIANKSKEKEAVIDEIENILDESNLTYNISIGDTLYLLNQLDNMDRSFEERYFLFVIRTMYSIKMYEYYDEIFEHDWNDESEEIEEGKNVMMHPIAELKAKTDYHKLVGGYLFNPVLCKFITDPFDVDIYNNKIDIQKLKDEIVSVVEKYKSLSSMSDSDDILTIKLFEFIMLCTSNTLDKSGKPYKAYRKSIHPTYSKKIWDTCDYVKFDLCSFFYNVSDIKSCYDRYSGYLDKEVVDKIINSDKSLWKELYNIGTKGSMNGNKFSLRDYTIKNIGDALNSYKPTLGSNKEVKHFTSEPYCHHWLSWVCVRNAEVYQAFVNHMQNNDMSKTRGDNKKATIVPYLKHFFAKAMQFQLCTYDISEDNQLPYRLNLNFILPVYKLLNEIDNNNNISELLNDTILPVDSEANDIISRLKKAAITGDAQAQYQLGIYYMNGASVERNVKKAFRWLKKSAEHGNAFAQFSLGNCYKNGDGCEQDMQKAVEWYMKSAEQGYARAQYSLGNRYRLGEGVEMDLQKAVELYTQAAVQGYPQAQYNLALCYFYGHGVDKDYQQAVEWYGKAAEKGHASSQLNLGYCYSNGLGVEEDTGKAFELYTKAAEQGNIDAKNNIAIYFYEAKGGVGQDKKKACDIFESIAEEQKSGESYYYLGLIYENDSDVVTTDKAKAMECYEKSAERGYEKAKDRLKELEENQ